METFLICYLTFCVVLNLGLFLTAAPVVEEVWQ